MSNADQADPAPKAAEDAAPRLLSHMATLPEDVKQRVTTLQEIQKQHDEIEAEFHKERAALIAKYQKLYGPFYEKRASIINGDVETPTPTEGTEVSSKGVPEFWLTAMKANDVVGIQITDKDQGALKYLKDIKVFYLDEPKGFRLEFYFAENPYFTNTVLTKEYHMMDEDEPILERAIATKIDWKPGKNLTVKLMKKKPKKGAKDDVVQTKLQECDSFFNFFNPPKIPGDDEDIDIDEAEELQDVMEQDYDVGATIRDKIIPHAVSWYTGEALQGELDEEESGDEEDDEDDEEDDEDEDDDEYEEDESESDAAKKDETPTSVKTEEVAQK